MKEQSPCFDKGALNLHLSSELAEDFLIRIWILKPDKTGRRDTTDHHRMIK